jgi:rhodanese-related sulfurtransferase
MVMTEVQHRAFKTRLYEQFARIPKALANPHRLELVDLLAQGPRTVEDLAREAGLSVANASQHLQILRSARLVSVRREGLYSYYSLAGEAVFAVWQAMRALGEQQYAEIREVVTAYLQEREQLEPLSSRELLERLRRDDVILLDVRPELEYHAGHIPGAHSLPVAELETRLREIPSDCEVIAYCRGPYCVFADEAVAVLRERGYRARRLAGGLPDWRAEGLPVEP